MRRAGIDVIEGYIGHEGTAGRVVESDLPRGRLLKRPAYVVAREDSAVTADHREGQKRRAGARGVRKELLLPVDDDAQQHASRAGRRAVAGGAPGAPEDGAP